MKTTAAAAAAAAAILGTSLMAPFHSFKSLGTAAHCGGRLVVLGPAWHFVMKWVLHGHFLGNRSSFQFQFFDTIGLTSLSNARYCAPYI
jgi:hypothetical protein